MQRPTKLAQYHHHYYSSNRLNPPPLSKCHMTDDAGNRCQVVVATGDLDSYQRFQRACSQAGILYIDPAIEAAPRSQKRLLWLEAVAAAFDREAGRADFDDWQARRRYPPPPPEPAHPQGQTPPPRYASVPAPNGR